MILRFLNDLCLFKRLLIGRCRGMSVFTMKVNPVTGKTEWELQDEDYDYHQEIARSAFADMLHDTDRNQKYYTGIRLAIQKKHREGKLAHVLDIGTGTGLLSMMAATSGADSIVACEAFQAMAECAKKVIQENGFSDRIHIIPKRSTDLTVGASGDLKFRANILVTEVFDTELIGEGAILTFQHALEHLLEEDCIVVPSAGRVYAHVVSSSLASKWNRLQPLADLNIPDKIQSCPGSAAVHDIQLSQFPQNQFRTIIPPTEVLRFDWTGKIPLKKTDRSCKASVAHESGAADVVFMWWDLVMDTEGDVILSCAPDWTQTIYNIPWRDHWMQAVYYLPDQVPVEKGDQLYLYSHHDEFSLWFSLSKTTLSVHHGDDEHRPVCKCGLHVAFGRTRIGAMNDADRNRKYVNALKGLVTCDTVCVCLSDGSLLGPLAAQLGAKTVYCLDGNSLTCDVTQSIAEHNNVQDKVMVCKYSQDFKLSDKITLVIGEPHFVTSLLPWHNIYFWYMKNKLFPSSVRTMPVGATIWGMAVQFDHLWKIRAPLHSVEGFKMTDFDKLIEGSSNIADSAVEPQPLWEYPCEALTQPFKILEFDFTTTIQQTVETQGQVVCEGEGTCHAVVLWVDWDLDGSPDNVITTGPIETPRMNSKVAWDMHTRQGVFFLHSHNTVGSADKLYHGASFRPHEGDIQFHFDTHPLSAI